MKKLMLVIISMLVFIPSVYAKDITDDTKIEIEKVKDKKVKEVLDRDETSYITVKSGKKISIKSKKNIYGLYIMYEVKGIPGEIKAHGTSMEIGNYGFAHEYINTSEQIGITKELTIKYDKEVKITEIYVLDDGELPEYVEIWNEPVDKADLLVVPTHSDDEHLFFAGLIPYYLDKGAIVQVAYFTNHFEKSYRVHEQLHGLYKAGIRNYPVFGIVPDKKSYTKKAALKHFTEKTKLGEEDLIKNEVQLIRRFRPLVIAGHDVYGEYSHGQHILNTYILKETLTKTNDSKYDPESYETYGGWDVPKVYLHLYYKNNIIMNYDTPLESFDGKSAYEVSREAFNEHTSQLKTWFNIWLNGEENEFTTVNDIETFSPTKFGLYHSLVGTDKLKNDMFENLYMRNHKKFDENKIVRKTKISKTVTNESNYIYIILGIVLLIVLLSIIKLIKKK